VTGRRFESRVFGLNSFGFATRLVCSRASVQPDANPTGPRQTCSIPIGVSRTLGNPSGDCARRKCKATFFQGTRRVRTIRNLCVDVRGASCRRPKPSSSLQHSSDLMQFNSCFLQIINLKNPTRRAPDCFAEHSDSTQIFNTDLQHRDGPTETAQQTRPNRHDPRRERR
jgi:hypothetical protein